MKKIFYALPFFLEQKITLFALFNIFFIILHTIYIKNILKKRAKKKSKKEQ